MVPVGLSWMSALNVENGIQEVLIIVTICAAADVATKSVVLTVVKGLALSISEHADEMKMRSEGQTAAIRTRRQVLKHQLSAV